MGNGASSKNGKDQKKDQDLGDEDQEEDFDSYARKKAQENRSGQQRLEQAGLLPKLESTPERSKPVVRETIIGLDDSDDDEAIKPKKNTTKSKPRNKKEDEKELRKEIMELEKTFESLDLDSGSVSTYNNHTSVKKSTFSRGGLFRSSTIDEGSYQSRPNNGPNRRPPPVFGTPAVSKPLKFSWQESSAPAVVDKHTDDWNYQQTVIDGFDPDKFRKVNKDKNSPQDSGIRIERQFGSASSSDSGIRMMGAGATNTRMTTIEMPGVPSYDNTEKQLLASLEQELGVL